VTVDHFATPLTVEHPPDLATLREARTWWDLMAVLGCGIDAPAAEATLTARVALEDAAIVPVL
jgi:hypothetical protein